MSQPPVAPPSPPLIVIVGPTAVGKSETALLLAEALGGELISADSRQFYRGMDIGTAKPSAGEQARVPHHLVDICDPQETLTLADFQSRCYELIGEITARGHLPLLVGGTGLYVRAVVEGYGIPRVPPDEPLRHALFQIAAQQGEVALHRRLAEVDSEAARQIDPRNVRRVVRALEVYEKSGTPISLLQRKQPPPVRVLTIGLTRPREELYARVDARIARMLEAGLVAETKGLLEAGVPPESEAMSALGYRESVAFLRGDLENEAALADAMRQSTRRLVRAQANWFRRDDPRIRWFDRSTTSQALVLTFVSAWLAGR